MRKVQYGPFIGACLAWEGQGNETILCCRVKIIIDAYTYNAKEYVSTAKWFS